MDVQDAVRRHYSRSGLAGVVLRAVAASGVDLDHLKPDDLGSIDQLHHGGAPTTGYLLEQLALSPSTRLLDVGGGLGGPARMAAARYGCPVVSVDLSPDYVEAARTLTERVGLADRVQHVLGSADSLDAGPGTFQRAMMVHVGMNLPDKAAVFAEVRRVLAADALFGLFEQVRTGPGELTYPLPWADDPSSSFVVDLATLTASLEAAGFAVERTEDRSAAVPGPMPPGTPAGLTPGTIFGPPFAERINNDIAAIRAGLLAPVVVVARAV